MAAQVLAGTGALTYTNNTGENVRIVINYLEVQGSYPHGGGSMTWGGGASVALPQLVTFGKNLAATREDGQNVGRVSSGGFDGAPTELALANGDTFSFSAPSYNNASYTYNILVIPESG